MPDDDRIAQNVREHGWHALAVAGTDVEPSFVYSIGLAHTFGHPELLVFGLESRVAYGVVAGIASDVKAGRTYEAGQRYAGLLEGYDVAVRPVHPTQHILRLGYAMAFYRRLSRPDLLTARQVFWPDKAGRFPFDLACDPQAARMQPRMELAVPPSELQAFLDQHGA